MKCGARLCFAAYELGVPFVTPFATPFVMPFVRIGTLTPFVVAIVAAGETVKDGDKPLEGWAESFGGVITCTALTEEKLK